MPLFSEYNLIGAAGAKVLGIDAGGVVGLIAAADLNKDLAGTLTPTANVSVINVGNRETVVTANTADTTIQTMSNGIPGQEVDLVVADAFTSIGVGGNIATPTGAALKLTSGRVYRLLFIGSTWRLLWNQEGRVSADKGDAGATLTVGVDESVQRWATPLTAARTVTLAPCTLNGGYFDIVRAAGATGAFDLIVKGNSNTELYRFTTFGKTVRMVSNGSAWSVLTVSPNV